MEQRYLQLLRPAMQAATKWSSAVSCMAMSKLDPLVASAILRDFAFDDVPRALVREYNEMIGHGNWKFPPGGGSLGKV